MLDDVKDLEGYFSRFGATLGARAAEALDPLHRPAIDPIHPGIADLTRELLPAQAHLVTGLVKGWERQKALFLAGQCGVGKTTCACASVHLSARGKPYRALVMCPDHLIAKWMANRSDVDPEIRDRLAAHLEAIDGVLVHNGHDWIRDEIEATEAALHT